MNKKIIKAATDVETAEKAAGELLVKLQTTGADAKTVTCTKSLLRKIQEVRQDIYQLEMDSRIVDVVRAFDEARSTLTK